MATTIQISNALQTALAKKKLSERETYEEVLWDLLEDTQELSAEAKQELAAARSEIAAGKVRTLAQVKEELGL